MGSMFNNISRIFDSGRTRSSGRDRRSMDYDHRRYESEPGYYETERRYYEPEPVMASEPVSKAGDATIRALGREKTELQAQVAELRQQIALLENLVDAKEEQVRKLEEAMEVRDTQSMDILKSKILESDEKIDALSNNLNHQLQGLSDKIDERFGVLTQKVEAGGGGVDRSDEMINVISENVHNESVKCYRNIQTILEEIEDKLNVIENKKVSMLGTSACVVITMLVSMGSLALIVLRILGII